MTTDRDRRIEEEHHDIAGGRIAAAAREADPTTAPQPATPGEALRWAAGNLVPVSLYRLRDTLRRWAAELDAAPSARCIHCGAEPTGRADPGVYRLPDNPDGPLWDRHGHRWQRVGAVSWGRTDELDDPHWRSWSWPDLLATRGPLSTTPPAGTEASDA